MDPVKRKTETTFFLSSKTPKNLYRVKLETEIAGERITSTVNELFTEEQAKALMAKVQKGK